MLSPKRQFQLIFIFKMSLKAHHNTKYLVYKIKYHQMIYVVMSVNVKTENCSNKCGPIYRQTISCLTTSKRCSFPAAPVTNKLTQWQFNFLFFSGKNWHDDECHRDFLHHLIHQHLGQGHVQPRFFPCMGQPNSNMMDSTRPNANQQAALFLPIILINFMDPSRSTEKLKPAMSCRTILHIDNLFNLRVWLNKQPYMLCSNIWGQ